MHIVLSLPDYAWLIVGRLARLNEIMRAHSSLDSIMILMMQRCYLSHSLCYVLVVSGMDFTMILSTI